MKIAVVGSGAWGTALAIRLHKNNHELLTDLAGLAPFWETCHRAR